MVVRHARGACFIGYKLDHKRHGDIRAALDLRDAMGPEPAVIHTLAGGQTAPGHIAEAGIG